MSEIAVEEKSRLVSFTSGEKKTFYNVKWFDNSGNWLRIGSDEGYTLLNPDNINFITVPLEAKER